MMPKQIRIGCLCSVNLLQGFRFVGKKKYRSQDYEKGSIFLFLGSAAKTEILNGQRSEFFENYFLNLDGKVVSLSAGAHFVQLVWNGIFTVLD